VKADNADAFGGFPAAVMPGTVVRFGIRSPTDTA